MPKGAAPRLRLGYSPCPNDCFIFYALSHGKVEAPAELDIRLADVETLNRWALGGKLELTKLSYHAYALVADRYVMLPAGGALGRGVGPLLVSREPLPSLSGRRVATPGGLTTANLLLRLSQPAEVRPVELRYDRIMPAVAAGEFDAGLIIHESRFTYQEYGLRKHLDLGEWWEGVSAGLLPLGGIAGLRALGSGLLYELNAAIRASLAYARAHPQEAASFVAEHAQEMSEEVRNRHIDLYVNGYSDDLGREGRLAVRALFEHAAARGLVRDLPAELVLPGQPSAAPGARHAS